MTQPSQQAQLCPLFYQVPAAEIVLMKSLLESYEHLGELRTLDSDAGIVVVLALDSTIEVVRRLLESEQALLKLRPIDPPSDFAGDWLLKELYQE